MDFTEQVSQLKWFHSIDFGDFASSGRFPKGDPQNYTLYGTFELLQYLDLSKANVLDLGTYDGIVAFGAHKLGAASVHAVDTFENAAFHLARKVLGYEDDIVYRPGIQVRDLPEQFDNKQFDVIVCAGILYHMLHPMQAFTDCRKVLGDGGILILETPYEHRRDDAVLIFNGVEKVVNEPYTYFVPTLAALKGMASLAGFQLIATRVLTGPRRVTLMLQAVERDQLIADENVAEFTKQMLKRDTCDDSFRFKNIEATKRPSPILIDPSTRIQAYREIDRNTEDVKFPHHPPTDKVSYGSTRFETAKGNVKVL